MSGSWRIEPFHFDLHFTAKCIRLWWFSADGGTQNNTIDKWEEEIQYCKLCLQNAHNTDEWEGNAKELKQLPYTTSHQDTAIESTCEMNSDQDVECGCWINNPAPIRVIIHKTFHRRSAALRIHSHPWRSPYISIGQGSLLALVLIGIVAE